MAYKTLKSVIKNYPKVAEFVLGETKLTILDETGIPTDTKRVEVIRGSYKRGALKGAIIGCVILLLYVLSRRTVKSRKDLKKNINLQDLGSIPYVRTKKRKKETFYNSVSLLNERISMSYLEAIRKLRIRIMKDVEKKEYQTLLVTSSIPGEGKTTLSANLAISIAQQGKKVLLVDCDLRNPSIAGVMNCSLISSSVICLFDKTAAMRLSSKLPIVADYQNLMHIRIMPETALSQRAMLLLAEYGKRSLLASLPHF